MFLEAKKDANQRLLVCWASGRQAMGGREVWDSCDCAEPLCVRRVLICCWWIAGSDVASIKLSFLYVYVLKAAALQGDTLGSIRVKLLFVSFSAAACACCCWDWDPSRLVSASCTIFCDVSSLFISRHNFPLCGAHLLATCEWIFNLTRRSSLSSRLQKAHVTHKFIMKNFVI